mgnify:CR=1 FL=1
MAACSVFTSNLDAVFRTEPPMSAAEQKEAFEEALSGALEEAYNLEVAQAIHRLSKAGKRKPSSGAETTCPAAQLWNSFSPGK